MCAKQRLYPVQTYSIDDNPLNADGSFTLDENALKELGPSGIGETLFFGLANYRFTLEIKNRDSHANPNLVRGWHFLANTGFGSAIYDAGDKVRAMMDHQPNVAVTDLDKALLGSIYNCYLSIFFRNEDEYDKQMMYCFISFLHCAQKFELETGKTINIKTKNDEQAVFSLLLGKDASLSNIELVDLKTNEIELLREVISFRRLLIEETLRQRQKEREFVNDVHNQHDWQLFIDYLNYCNDEEQTALGIVKQSIPTRNKINSLEKYRDFLISRYEQPVFDTGIIYVDLLKKIDIRREQAPNYCELRDEDGKQFLLDLQLLSEYSFAVSFNSLLTLYHLFLLHPTLENRCYLATFLLVYLKGNLARSYTAQPFRGTFTSLVIEANDLIFAFYEKHKETIHTLKFKSIQKDETICSQGDADHFIREKVRDRQSEISKQNEDQRRALDENKQILIYKELGEAATADSISDWYNHYTELYDNLVGSDNQSYENLWEQEVSKRLIVSINAIYIFVKMLDNSLEKNYEHGSDRETIKSIRDRMAKLEQYLVKSTYIPPDFMCFDNVDMDEYRVKMGIDSTEIEKESKELTQIALFDITIDKLNMIHEQIRDTNLDDAIRIKDDLRKEMSEYPDSKLKEYLIDKIDQVSQKLCRSLVTNSSKRTDFSKQKTLLRRKLGRNSYRMPGDALNTLTTAELLYSQYALSNIADSHFDYSCISSLYYQAVESVYNKIIWTDYADLLNKLKHKNGWFTSLYIRKTLPPECQDYLPDGDTKYYWNADQKRITHILTMGTFAYLLKNITSETSRSLIHFSEHVDKVFNMSGIGKQSQEYQRYQHKIDELYRKIKRAAPRRNNASHGEEPLDLQECQEDRKIVLEDVENDRAGALGIIQLFLSMYRDK